MTASFPTSAWWQGYCRFRRPQGRNDGIEFHEQLLVVAMGIDSQGKKEILGLRQGRRRTARSCKMSDGYEEG